MGLLVNFIWKCIQMGISSNKKLDSQISISYLFIWRNHYDCMTTWATSRKVPTAAQTAKQKNTFMQD